MPRGVWIVLTVVGIGGLFVVLPRGGGKPLDRENVGGIDRDAGDRATWTGNVVEGTMWPFKRREADVAEIVWDGSWVVGQGSNQGRPMLVRRNTGAGALVGHSRFSLRLGIAVPLRNPDADGMPVKAELGALARIEDALVTRLQADRKAVAVLTITTGGMREFVFYTGDGPWAAGVVDELRGEITTHEIQSYIASDAKWEVYKAFDM